MKKRKIYGKVTAAMVMILASMLTMAAGSQAGKTISQARGGLDTIPLARKAFVDMNVEVLDLLDHTTRANMLDYYAADSVWKAPNEMGGLSYLDTVTNDYLKVTLTEVSNLQIKILPEEKGGYVVMTIYTIGGEEETPDSEVRFFDSELRPLETKKYVKLPELANFFSIPKGCKTNMKEIKSLIPFPTMEYEAKSGENTLTGKLTVGDYMMQDDWNVIKIFLVPEVTLHWDGKKFK